MTRQGHRVGISPKLLDILLDPMESGHLVHQPIVGHPRMGMRIGIGIEETCGVINININVKGNFFKIPNNYATSIKG